MSLYHSQLKGTSQYCIATALHAENSHLRIILVQFAFAVLSKFIASGVQIGRQGELYFTELSSVHHRTMHSCTLDSSESKDTTVTCSRPTGSPG